jgi:tetratricopeptide (TPR) repeat protein
MPDLLLFAVNGMLPGSGLVLRRRLVSGLGLLLAALAALSVAAISLGAGAEAAAQLRGGLALLAYLGCVAAAALCWWLGGVSATVDAMTVHQLYRAAATAFLAGELSAAEAGARALTRALPTEAGSWRVLALVARARGRSALATAAGQRAIRLDNQPT